MTQPLTAIERRVYDYLLDFTAQNTFQPSIREIGKRFRIKSTKTVSDLLQSLAAKGYIERDASRSRGVRLLGFAGATRARPVAYYGRIHAGEPALLDGNREGFFTLDRRFIPSETTFILRVKGDSMIGAGIHDGDYVLVNPSATPAEHEIVAIRDGEGSALKKISHEAGDVVLRAANPSVPPERLATTAPLQVLGVLCGVFRPFHDSGAGTEEDHGTETDGVAAPVKGGSMSAAPRATRPILLS